MGGFIVVLLLMGTTLAVDMVASADQASIADRIVNHLDPARIAAARIVTLVRAADDDGAWMVNSMSGDKKHSDELAQTYYQEVAALSTTIDQAMALADTTVQRAAIQKFRDFYWGTKPLTESDLKTLDAQSQHVFTGSDSYLFGNEQVFAEARSGQYLKAAFDYTTVPFIGALDSAQIYIDAVQKSIDQATIDESSAAGMTQTLSLGLGLAAATLGLFIGWLLSRSIMRGVKAVQVSVTSLSDHCGTWLAEGMERLRDNDLTYAITPVTPKIGRYGSDEIGATAAKTDALRDSVVDAIEAYNGARASLTATVREVKSASEAVARSSEELTAAANLSGQASLQISQTFTQVAVGAQDQAQAASSTPGAVGQLGGVIGDVGAGAAETMVRIEASSAAVNRLTIAIAAVGAASAEVAGVSERAAGAAAEGLGSVNRTITGMDRIKDAVGASDLRVSHRRRAAWRPNSQSGLDSNLLSVAAEPKSRPRRNQVERLADRNSCTGPHQRPAGPNRSPSNAEHQTHPSCRRISGCRRRSGGPHARRRRRLRGFADPIGGALSFIGNRPGRRRQPVRTK
jgi:methyl-accepting chemotaxis protein